MGKLFDRVVRLENKLDDHNRIRCIEQDVMNLRLKINALAEHLGLQFKEGTVAIEKRDK